MRNVSGIKHPSAWVPQLFFDLIGRVIPGGSLILLTFAVGDAVGIEEVSQILSKSKEFLPSFLSLSIVLIAGLLASYVVATLLWGMWISAITFLAVISGWKFDPETLVAVDQDEFAEKYELLKSKDQAAGGRATKLKAEIHMSSTLFVGLVFLLIVVLSASEPGSLLWSFLILLGIWGSLGSLLHFRKRIRYVVIGM